METLQNYGFDIVVLLALAICAVGFLVVANNCIATYSGDPERAQAVERSGLDGRRRQHSSGGHHLAAQSGFGRPVIWRPSPFPDRLNREPVVWRGLTTSELFLALALGLGGGCAFGILLALITHYWPLIPGSALAGAVLLIQGGGRIPPAPNAVSPIPGCRRRSSPRLERHHLRGAQLVQHSAVWVVRRSRDEPFSPCAG